MKRLLRKKIIIPLLLLVIALSFWLLRPTNSKTQQFQFAKVKRQNIKAIVSSSGNLAGKNSANLKFKSPGKLSYINVKAGDKVFSGQLIATLDTQDLAIALKQAQNTLRDKQATVDKIHDDVKGHDTDETFTQRVTRTTAEAAVDNAYDSVKAAQRAFQDANLISPLDGIITQSDFVSGQTVSTADIIAQVVDTSKIYFDTDVDEADIGKVTLGQSSEVTLDAYPNQTFSGLVDQIKPQTKTTSSGATVISVRILLQNPPGTFVNGLSGQSAIIISEAKNVLTIPVEALRDDNTVFVEGAQLVARPVEPGLRSDTDVEIKKGLSETDSVILNPPATGVTISRNRNLLQRIIFPRR